MTFIQKNIILQRPKWSQFLLLCVFCLLFAACSSSKKATDGSSEIGNKTSIKYAQQVIALAQSEKSVSAKSKVLVQVGDKQFNINGTLHMLRDDVIQLSLSMLGFEVGRIEFSTSDVLVIDRFHKQYMRVPYSSVDFLQKANIDFGVLQAVFWNELFIPGTKSPSVGLHKFSMAESGDHTLLNLTTEPKLDYAFLTQTATHLIKRTTIKPKGEALGNEFICRYPKFSSLAGKQFPSTIELSFQYEGKSATLMLELSDLNNKTNWEAHTSVSSKYKQMEAKGVFQSLLNF